MTTWHGSGMRSSRVPMRSGLATLEASTISSWTICRSSSTAARRWVIRAPRLTSGALGVRGLAGVRDRAGLMGRWFVGRVPARRGSLGLHRVPAELLAQGGGDLGAERLVLAAGEPREERQRDDRRRHIEVDGLAHRPASLAGVRDPAPDISEVLAMLLERQPRELQQPRADDRAVLPCCGDAGEVERELGCVEDLEAL